MITNMPWWIKILGPSPITFSGKISKTKKHIRYMIYRYKLTRCFALDFSRKTRSVMIPHFGSRICRLGFADSGSWVHFYLVPYTFLNAISSGFQDHLPPPYNFEIETSSINWTVLPFNNGSSLTFTNGPFLVTWSKPVLSIWPFFQIYLMIKSIEIITLKIHLYY